jgi:hypothetical protein
LFSANAEGVKELKLVLHAIQLYRACELKLVSSIAEGDPAKLNDFVISVVEGVNKLTVNTE